MDEQASTSKAIPSTSHSTPSVSSMVNSANSEAASSSSISSAAQNERNQKLLLIIYKYLQKQMNENQSLNAVQKESLEVVVHCLGYAFQFFEFDFVEHNLEKIYEFFVKHKKVMDIEDFQEQKPKAVEISPEDIVAADEFKEKGNKLMREEKFKEALDFYDKAIALNPKEPALYCNRAAAHNNLNKFREAIHDCNMAISFNGSYAKAHVRKGLAYEKLKDFKRASNSYKKAHLLEPENEHYKNLYNEASKRLKPRQDESTSTPGTSFNMFLGSNMSSVPFVDEIPALDNLMETIFSGVERQWQNGQNQSQNQQDPDDSSYNYFS